MFQVDAQKVYFKLRCQIFGVKWKILKGKNPKLDKTKQ